MNAKKYLLAVVAAFVLYSGLGFGIHEVILKQDYQPLIGQVLRTEEAFADRIPYLYVANLVFALAFCCIYVKGYEAGKGWLGQGLRFGLIAGTLLAPFALTEYVVFPVSGWLALKWIGFGYLQVIITGLGVAGIYRPQS